MKRTDVVVIGAGQAGLAMSGSLTARNIGHVVLERGRIGERWRSERWHSLRLLTPASYSALPLPRAASRRRSWPAATTGATSTLPSCRPRRPASMRWGSDICGGGARTPSPAAAWTRRSSPRTLPHTWAQGRRR